MRQYVSGAPTYPGGRCVTHPTHKVTPAVAIGLPVMDVAPLEREIRALITAIAVGQP